MPRLTFINWRPDLEDEANDGLVVADNVLHEPEGYKSIGLESAGAFATNASLGTVTSVQIRNAGSADNQVAAWVNIISATTAALSVGTPGGGIFSSITAQTVTSINTITGTSIPDMGIVSFDVCELDGKIFVTAVARANQAGGNVTRRFTGYVTY